MKKETPTPAWHPLFAHMSTAHGLTLIDDELNQIARAVDRSRKEAIEHQREHPQHIDRHGFQPGFIARINPLLLGEPVLPLPGVERIVAAIVWLVILVVAVYCFVSYRK